MADDGMLLNFNFSDAVAPVRNNNTNIKGGKWTSRLKAKRATQGRLAKTTEKTAQIEKPSLNDRPNNTYVKPVEEEHSSGHHSNSHSGHQNSNSGGRPRGPPAGADGTFVSSLWTGNPEPVTAAPEEPVVEAEAQAPSNAPISDGSSTFTTLGLSPILASHLTTKLALKAPTAIQRSAIPDLLTTDSDAFIQAETGSGKTLTYLLPIVDRIMRTSSSSTRASGLYAIILAPTRELSRQIYEVLQTLIHCKNGPNWIVPGQVTGGEKKKSEKARIRKGMNILVATPGRLLDHLETTKNLAVDRVRWLVLDEGDRLIELGFEETIGKILDILNAQNRPNMSRPNDTLPGKRVTMLCSATMKSNVQRLGEKSLQDALYIKSEKEETADGATEEEQQFSAPAQLRQSYLITPAKLRLVALNAVLQRAFIRETASPKVIVFFSCTDSVDFHFEVFTRPGAEADAKAKKHPLTQVTAAPEVINIEDRLKNKRYPTDGSTPAGKTKPVQTNPAVSPAVLLHPKLLVHKLHGSLAQPVRTSTLASFTNATGPAILFCTDVAARGLDLPNVDLIVQFDPPFSPDDHLHRIGRTARAGRDGRAIMFLLPGPEEGYVDAVLKKGIREGQLVRSELDDIIEKGYGTPAKKGERKEKKRDWEDKATEWHLDVERWVMANPMMKELASKAWGSQIRAYTTHVSAEKKIFNHKGLHYGHLAKSFGLRDSPTTIKVPKSDGSSTARGGKTADGNKRKLPDDVGEYAGEDAMKKMRKAARMMEKAGMSSEFNIG